MVNLKTAILLCSSSVKGEFIQGKWESVNS